MNKLMFLLVLAASCTCATDSSSEKLLQKGECYHTLGDLGGVPSEIFCAQSVGSDEGIVINEIPRIREYQLLIECGTSFMPIWVKDTDIISIVTEN